MVTAAVVVAVVVEEMVEVGVVERVADTVVGVDTEDEAEDVVVVVVRVKRPPISSACLREIIIQWSIRWSNHFRFVTLG